MTRRSGQTATLSSKGQLTIPRAVRTQLGLAPGSLVLITAHGEYFTFRPLREEARRTMTLSLDLPEAVFLELEADAQRVGTSVDVTLAKQLLQAKPCRRGQTLHAVARVAGRGEREEQP